MQVAAAKKKLQGSDSHWFLFLLMPFFAAITAVRNYKSPWAKNIVWAFVIFYGYTFAISKENDDTDIIRYVDELKELYGKSLSFGDILDLFRESGDADVVRTIIAIVVSRFSNNAQVLTAVYGFIFGFFYSRCIWYITERMLGKLKWATVLMIAVYVLINPFWNLNGFRFNTAILVFMYGALPFLFEKNKFRLIWCYLSVLVHFSFLFPIAILTIYLLAGNRKTVYFTFFVLSVFISNINITTFNSVMEQYVPEAFLERSEKYRDEDRVEEFREGDRGATLESTEGVVIVKNWYAVYYLRLMYWSLSAMLITIYIFGGRVFAGNKWVLNGYCFSLLFFGFANIMVSLPSGERYLMIASMLSAATVIFYLQNQQHEKYLTSVTSALVPALLVFIIVSVRTGFYSISITTLLGNPIIMLFTDYNLSINDIIK